MGRALPCEIGRGGARADKAEGDGATPAGRWRMARVLWRADRLPRPRTALPCRPIGPRDGWSDDPACPRYNRPVTLPHAFSAERLRRRDRLYDVVVVTDHNAAGVPGAGSAVFLHVRRGPGRPTAGCVAFERADLLWLLARWRPEGRLARGRVDVAPWREPARRLSPRRDGG
jgi:L,D-peptidoglycan transpeptidase YkuD (ErfK/YbiS/YcfS/YnhG family)